MISTGKSPCLTGTPNILFWLVAFLLSCTVCRDYKYKFLYPCHCDDLCLFTVSVAKETENAIGLYVFRIIIYTGGGADPLCVQINDYLENPGLLIKNVDIFILCPCPKQYCNGSLPYNISKDAYNKCVCVCVCVGVCVGGCGWVGVCVCVRVCVWVGGGGYVTPR